MRDKTIKILISLQFILFPFLDMLRTTNFKNTEFLGISLIELINILIIGMALVLTLLKMIKRKKRYIFGLVIYLIICLLYIYAHYKHISTFDITIFERASFNFITETFYICRVYILPLMMLFILYNNRDILNKNFYLKISKIVIAIISFSIVILDFFKISYISYSANHDFVSHNFIDYFLYSGDYKLLSGRGWFDSANELSAILLMFFPINIYILYKEQSNFNKLLFVTQFLAMIILGTRTAAFGSVMICVAIGISYIVLILIKKEKSNYMFIKKFGIISLVLTAYMCISPFMFGRINDSNYDFSVQDESAYKEIDDIKNIDDEEELEKIFAKYSNEYLINEAFLKMYPINNDKEFWISMAKRDRALNNNSRIMKTDILARVKERNNNSMDTYYGLGYTLNFMDIERDYVYQYYIFGIFGIVLFICPYFILLIISLLKVLKRLFDYIKMSTIIFFMCPMLVLTIAYLSGHVFGWVSPMMFLVFSLGLLNFYVREEKCENE